MALLWLRSPSHLEQIQDTLLLHPTSCPAPTLSCPKPVPRGSAHQHRSLTAGTTQPGVSPLPTPCSGASVVFLCGRIIGKVWVPQWHWAHFGGVVGHPCLLVTPRSAAPGGASPALAVSHLQVTQLVHQQWCEPGSKHVPQNIPSQHTSQSNGMSPWGSARAGVWAHPPQGATSPE